MCLERLTIVSVIIVIAMTGCTNGGAPGEQVPVPPRHATTPEASDPPAEPTPANDAETAPVEKPASPEPLPETATSRVALGSAASAPPLDQMALAKPVGKIGVPVDVRYQVSGVVAKDQPATVQLAFVPRVAGSNLRVEFPETAGVTIDAGSRAIRAEKATSSDVLRHSVLVTPTDGDSGEMRAIVSMDFDGGRYFSIFSIPVGAQPQTTMKRPPKG